MPRDGTNVIGNALAPACCMLFAATVGPAAVAVMRETAPEKRPAAIGDGCQSVLRFTRIIVASPEATWFETREGALLTMRVDLVLRSIAKAMRLEGRSH